MTVATLIATTFAPMWGGHAPASAGASDAEVKQRIEQGIAALTEGDQKAARFHLLGALALDPESAAAYGGLLRMEAAEPDARLLWLHEALPAVAAKGSRFEPPESWPELPKDQLIAVRDLHKQRAKAADAVLRAASRMKGSRNLASVRWLRALHRQLTRGAPTLRDSALRTFADAESACHANADTVTAALRQVATSALREKRHGVALEAARTLRGILLQQGQTDPAKHARGAGITEARRLAERARAGLEGPSLVPLTLEDLEAIPREQEGSFLEAHREWETAGVAVSPKGLYRIATTCGFPTLLVATRDIEVHHARLADWFGSDPFGKERPGIVRLCRNVRDFEGEGQPFWWAGGFQSGDLTTAIVNFTDAVALGSLLTHELTHRFDQGIYPGIPAWAAEGRAVYAENCSPDPLSESLDERMLDVRRLRRAREKRFDQRDKLVSLVNGTLEDYRSNYFAGYALWLFLERFRGFDIDQEGEPLFRSAIPRYLKSFASEPGTSGQQRLTTHFADGKAGRPKSFDELAALFSRFIRDMWGDDEDTETWWTTWEDDANRADQTRVTAMSRDRIVDRGTWPTSRRRHDRSDVGEEHAFAAAEILLAQGKTRPALEAFRWSLQVDEPLPARIARIAAVESESGDAAAAWTTAALARHAGFALDGASEAAAAPGSASGPWKRTSAFAKALASASVAAASGELPRTARALRAEHDALAHWLGTAALGLPDDSEISAPTERAPPDCQPYVSVLARGATQDDWKPLESAVSEDWVRTGSEKLQLGDAGARPQTGVLRDVDVRRIFLRGYETYDGTYTFRTKVRFLSAYADVRLVIGHTHRQRGLEIGISGGDWDYSVGENAEATRLESVRVVLNDLRPFGTETSISEREAWFRQPSENFEIMVRVSGPFVRVAVAGQSVLSYRRVTGAPIEGRIGFGLMQGVASFDEPTVRRHRVLGPDAQCPCEAHDEPVDLTRRGAFTWMNVIGRRTLGIPRSPVGTLLLWYDDSAGGARVEEDVVANAFATYLGIFEREDLVVPTRIAMPAADAERWPDGYPFPDPTNHGIAADHVHHHSGHRNLAPVLEYSRTGASGGHVIRPAPTDPTWMMLDAGGVVRSAGPFGDLEHARLLARALAGQ